MFQAIIITVAGGYVVMLLLGWSWLLYLREVCLLISRVEDFGYKFQQLHQSMIMNKDSMKCVLQSYKTPFQPEGEVEWWEGRSGVRGGLTGECWQSK